MCQTFGIYYNCLEKNFEKIFLKYLTKNSGAKNLWPFHFGNQKKEKKKEKRKHKFNIRNWKDKRG